MPASTHDLEAYLEHPDDETIAAASSRLDRYLVAAADAGHAGKLVVTRGRAHTADEIAAIEQALGVAIPPSLRELLASVGDLRIKGDGAVVRLRATAEKLDYETDVGLDLTGSYYAALYDLDEESYIEGAASAFKILAVADVTIADENAHEDGDVAVVVVNHEKGGERPVFHIPHDDGYEHERIGADAREWFSRVIDRVIRSQHLDDESDPLRSGG